VLTGVEQIDDQGVQAVNLTSGQEEHIACDLVVFQTGRSADPGPTGKGADLPVHRIGDCVTPRRISHALFDAQKAARTI
jgi:2,4-dienoyl-CoA reductase (NADPH2)